MFSRRKDSMKRKCYVFSRYKQRNKMSILYIQCELQEDKYGGASSSSSAIYVWKARKDHES